MAARNGKGRPTHLIAMQKAVKALEVRLEHKPWRKVAEEVGYANAGAAYNSVMSYLETQPRENREQFIIEETERLEALREKLAVGLPGREVVDVYLKVTDRIHRLQGINDKVVHSNDPKNPLPSNVTTNIQVNLNVLSAEDLNAYDKALAQLELAASQADTGSDSDGAVSSQPD